MKPFSRSQRVAGLIQKALSDLLHKGIHDPRLENVTITGVKMARDLKTAYIYYSSYQGELNSQDVAAGFNSAKGFTKRKPSLAARLRFVKPLALLKPAATSWLFNSP